MKKIMLLASVAMLGMSFIAAPANAQGVPQSVEITKVDVQKVATGYRAFADQKIMLPGGTKDGLKMLPAFQYANE